jgi:hypothetical protein
MHAVRSSETIDIRPDVSGAARGKRNALDTKSTVMTRVCTTQNVVKHSESFEKTTT